MKYWFTSDTHFGHSNIIRYCKRPFSRVDEMNEVVGKIVFVQIDHHGDKDV